MNISTRQLRAFIALAEVRNFTRAASVCHLSQSAFSALIRQLEDSLDVRLFDRNTRKVELTAEGQEFELSARRVLAEFESAVSDMHARATLQRGRVSIALLPSLAADWLPAVLAGFREGEQEAAAAGTPIRMRTLLTAMRHAARSREIAVNKPRAPPPAATKSSR